MRTLYLISMLIVPFYVLGQGKIYRPMSTEASKIEVTISNKIWNIDYSAPFASEVERGLEYELQGLVSQATDCFKNAANNGNLDAMRCLGDFYLRNKNYENAHSWYKKAAENGDAKSEFELGKLYGEGIGVTKDLSEAIIWYHQAAKHNIAEAQCILGDFYYNGIGVDSNKSEALKWYTKAAENGNLEAAQYLGDKYKGTLRKIYIFDKSKAKHW